MWMIVLRVIFIMMFVVTATLMWLLSSNSEFSEFCKEASGSSDQQWVDFLNQGSWLPLVWAILALLTWF